MSFPIRDIYMKTKGSKSYQQIKSGIIVDALGRDVYVEVSKKWLSAWNLMIGEDGQLEKLEKHETIQVAQSNLDEDTETTPAETAPAEKEAPQIEEKHYIANKIVNW